MNVKLLKDLTQEQVIEIAKLVYPFHDWIKSDFEVKYQPFDESWGRDAEEFWFVKFEAITFADKVDTYRLWIYPTLDLEFDAIRTKLANMTPKQKGEIVGDNIVLLGTFPIRNQHLIQKKFIEFGIEPQQQKLEANVVDGAK